jgi:hypothetical protein
MTLGLLDLSIVTERLVAMLDHRMQASPPSDPAFVIECNGLRPDDPKIKIADCQVSLYLFHVTPDKFHRNTFPLGGPARVIPEQPLALTLYYLLSVYAAGRFDWAQKAMSIALKCFHDNAIVIAKDNPEEFTLTIEPETVDEIGRLWQALACPLRMSAVYRASVMFLEPEPPPRTRPLTQLVLSPNVDAEPIRRAPPPVVLKAVVTSSGLATITGEGFAPGEGFVAGSIEMQIGSLAFPLSTNLVSTEPGRFRVVDPITIELRFPTGTPVVLKGKYLLRVRLDREHPTAELWLDVP